MGQLKKSSKRKTKHQTRTFYEGPKGRCPCCDRTTEVKIGGTLGPPNPAGWVVPLDTLKILYSRVAAMVREDAKGRLYVVDLKSYNPAKRGKLFFIDGGNNGIAGPFGHLEAKVFLSEQFGEEITENICIYIVVTNHKALTIICESPFAKLDESELNLDAPVDLF